jgi:hypothetical protein
VRSALETLPWVAKGSVEADIQSQQVRFAVNDKKAFDLEQLKRVIEAKRYRVGQVLSGP